MIFFIVFGGKFKVRDGFSGARLVADLTTLPSHSRQSDRPARKSFSGSRREPQLERSVIDVSRRGVASMGRLLPPLPLVVAVPMIAAAFPWLISASDSSETTMASLPFSFLKK